MSETTFEGWAVLELMGRRRFAGYVSEATLAGGAFVRIDVPAPSEDEDARSTQFYSPGAVYCITPTTEELARAFAQRAQPAPVSRWDLPALGAEPGHVVVDVDDDPEDED